MYPVSAKEPIYPSGVAVFSTDIAKARSVSENHLLAIIICELRKSDATEAIIKVPTKMGQNVLV